MKTPTFLVLCASLAVNAAFAFLLLRPSDHTASAHSGGQPSGFSAPASTRVPSPASAHPGAGFWSTLQIDDPKTQAARLREAGFPPEMVNAIVAAQLQESFAARRRALDPNAGKQPYWKTTTTTPEVQAAQRQLSRELDQAMRAALGEDYELTDPLSRILQQRQFGGIPQEKMSEVRQIMRDYADKQSALSAGGILVSADIDKLQALQREQQQAILAILSPEERAEYLVRSSSTAQSLRSRLAVFEPTEQEFRALFQLQYAFDEQFPSTAASLGLAANPAAQQELQRQRSEAQKLLAEQFKTALGPARAEEYTRAIDGSYQQAARLVARLELPPAHAVQIYDAQKEFQTRAAKLRSLPEAERNPQLAALEAEANARLAPLLGGTRGLEAYKINGGAWLQNIVPRPVPSPAVAR